MNFNRLGIMPGLARMAHYNRTNQQPTIDRIKTQDQTTDSTEQKQPKVITSEDLLNFVEEQRFQAFQPAKQQEEVIDPREAEVAKRLGFSAEEFHKLPEEQKQQMVIQFNREHPDNPIPDKLK